LGLSDKQSLIINQLDRGLAPSTYQNIMLEQAKSIELMINENTMSKCNQQFSKSSTKYNDKMSSKETEKLNEDNTGYSLGKAKK